METYRTRYALTEDGVNIAYQVRGNGPVDVLWVGGFTANLEVEYDGPKNNAAFYAELAGSTRLIVFDKRGTGLSDRTQTPDLEKRVDDMRAVLDAVGSERAVVLGAADGAALAAFFAGQPAVFLQLGDSGDDRAAASANLTGNRLNTRIACAFVAGEIRKTQHYQQLGAFNASLSQPVPDVCG